MKPSVRELVRQRVGNRCEYCRLPQAAAPFFMFHIEHIRAKQHGGLDEESNLALACPDCNAFKGPNLTSIDSHTDAVVPLFDPRTQNWNDHFVLQEAAILGVTPTGRATVERLQWNDAERLEMRSELLANDEWSWSFDE